MKSQTPNRQHDSLIVPEGFYVETYTPAAGKIKSPLLNKYLKYAKIILSEDANVTFKSTYGNSISAFPLAKGSHPFLVSEVSVVSAGTVLIIHDGILDDGVEQP